jgi:hypothetical protein
VLNIFSGGVLELASTVGINRHSDSNYPGSHPVLVCLSSQPIHQGAFLTVDFPLSLQERQTRFKEAFFMAA